MFSLITTVISVALVAALALATLYYGGDAYESGQAKAEAAKLRNQGQQLVAAAEFYYLQKGEWPETIQKMVDDGFLTTVPVAQRTALQEAVAGKAWVMPVQRQPLFTYDEVTSEVCSTLNQDSYGLKGILPKLQPGYMHQCFGSTKNDLLVVVGRGSLPDLVAAVNEGLLVPENVSSDPIPDPGATGAWTVPPGEAEGVDGTTTPPQEPEPGAFSLSPSELAFGSVATHFTGSKELSLQNTTSATVLLGVPSIAGAPEFSISETTCGTLLAAGASCSVTVSYSPLLVAEEQTATLTVGQSVTVPVRGAAYNPVSLESAVLPKGSLNKPYTNVSLLSYLRVSNEAFDEAAPLTWELEGALPTGLSFDTQSGVISGTPTQLTADEGQSFTILATYKNNQGQQVYTIRVGEAVLEVTQVSMGNVHACAVTTEGAAKCWGNNGHGQLGTGNNNASYTPVTVQGLSSGVVAISAGPNQSACAVLANGTAKCWGANGNGQLGDGSTTTRTSPVDVVGLTGAVSIGIGTFHACALTSGSDVYCWGYGPNLGTGGTGSYLTPTRVTSLAGTVIQLSVGAFHTCVVTNTGAAKCWGDNGQGQVGVVGSTTQLTPYTVSGLSTGVAQVSAGGSYHTCAVTTSGSAMCWGRNTDGQLGDGTTTQRKTPSPVSGASSGVSSISAGYNHSCLTTVGGAAKCWGNNSYGELGTGTNSNFLVPVNVSTISSGVSKILAGNRSTCVSSSAGALKCWGHNGNGQLGDGTKVNRLLPVDVVY